MQFKKIFDVCGPFTIPRVGKHTIVIDQNTKAEFWSQVEEKRAGLSGAIGCYIFAIQDGKAFTPIYVGKTERSFESETLTGDKINTYNKVVTKQRGYPVLFLLPKMQPNRRSFSTGSAGIATFEKLLIGCALLKNRDLLNSDHTDFLRTTRVTGIMNHKRGKTTAPAQKLRKALGLRGRRPLMFV